MNASNYDLKSELQAQAQLQPAKETGVKLTKDMSNPDQVPSMAPELKTALHSLLSQGSFTRVMTFPCDSPDVKTDSENAEGAFNGTVGESGSGTAAEDTVTLQGQLKIPPYSIHYFQQP